MTVMDNIIWMAFYECMFLYQMHANFSSSSEVFFVIVIYQTSVF